MEKTLVKSVDKFYDDYEVTLHAGETHFVPGTTKRLFYGPGKLTLRKWIDGTNEIVETTMNPRLK